MPNLSGHNRRERLLPEPLRFRKLAAESLEARDLLAFAAELVADLNQGPDPSLHGAPLVIGGAAYFAADDGINGAELWKTDGTPDGTSLVKDIRPGPLPSNPRNLTNLNGVLYFRADDGEHGEELWKSDGTPDGTTMVRDIAASGLSSYPDNFAVVGSKVYFTAEGQPSGETTLYGPMPYLSAANSPFDLSHLGTDFWLEDFEDGLLNTPGVSASFGFPRPPGSLTDSVDADDGAIDGDGLGGHSFLVRPQNSGVTFTFDRTALGGLPSYVGLVITGGGIEYLDHLVDFFDAGGNLISQTDENFPKPISGVTSDDRFVGMFHSTGISAIRVTNQGIGNSGFEVDHLQYGTVVQPAGTMQLWVSDGTPQGTALVQDLGYQPRYRSANIGGTFYYTGYEPATGIELWKVGASGPELVKDINPGPAGSGVRGIVNVNGKAFFSATDADHGDELWISDGTKDGTTLVKDINLGTANSSIAFQTNLNGSLVFSATTATNGSELWKSDGTEAGTVLLKEIKSGSGGSNPILFQNVNGTLFFAADDGTHFFELWKSDGTEAGTVLVKDIYLGDHSSGLTSLTNVNGTLFFNADDGTGEGMELWMSDGTEAGTVRAQVIAPGGYSATPQSFRVLPGRVIFTADDGIHGRELWTARYVAAADTVTVDAKANIFGAGHSSPPGEAPGILPTRINLPTGRDRSIQFGATGQVSFDTLDPDTRPYYGPDGGPITTNITATGGISGIQASTYGFLVGVFIGSNEPADPPPATRDFRGAANFTELSPSLNQLFFIGDGLTGTGSGQKQTFKAPDGATRLYLGLADSYDPVTQTISGPPRYYDDNAGQFQVSYKLQGTPINAAPRVTKGPDVVVTDEQTSVATTTVISFDGLSSDVPDTLFTTPYQEGGFTVTPGSGRWIEAEDPSHITGHPAPAIYGDTYAATLEVARTSGGKFAFSSVDMGSWGFGDPPTNIAYKIEGLLDGKVVFTKTGEVPAAETSGFTNVVTPSSTTIDLLRFSMTRLDSQAYLIDNIKLTIPSSITFDGLKGLTGQGEPLLPYSENGFNLTPVSSGWMVLATSSPTPTAEGNPPPAIWVETFGSALEVVRQDGTTFTFDGIDLFGYTAEYTFTGFRGDTVVFTQTGTIPQQGANYFVPTPSTSHDVIDRLLITFRRNATENIEVDNIRVLPAPPGSALAWATEITPGPPDESDQHLTFTITNNSDPSLFVIPPTIDAEGNVNVVPKPNVSGSATLTVRIQDDGGTVNGGVDSITETFVITVEKPHRWHNSAHPIDVDADLHYSATDTITLLDYLNSRSAGPGKVPDSAPSFGEAGFLGYLDVDGDGYVTSTDTITVINWLNSKPPGGPGPVEGSGEAAAAPVSSDLLWLLASDVAMQAKRRQR